MLNLKEVSHNTFRYLVLAFCISIIFDLVWFSFKSSDTKSASILTTFSVCMTYLAFLLRLLMTVVYWKDSLDFDNIMLGLKVDKAIRTINSV